MTPFDVPPGEMGIDPDIANGELEALLAGQGRDKNLDLTRFIDDLSTAFPAQAPAAAVHLAAIAHEAQLLADKGDPVARPASNAVAPVLRASRLPKRRRNTMKDRKARILIKIAAPVVAVFAILGLMGSAGALPRTLQHLTSHAAGFVGLDLPTGDDQGTDATGDQGDQNDQGTDVRDTTDQGDQNDQGDATSTDTTDQGDQNDQGDATSSDSTDQTDQGGSTDTSTGSDQGDQNDQGDSGGTSTGSDQGDQNDQGDSTGTSGGGSSENDQGDGGSTQDNQGDSSGDGGSGSGSSDGGSTSSGSVSGDNQD
jgi:hypothetical protein